MAKDDVSPGLLTKISRAFDANLSADKKAQKLTNKINGGFATYKDALEYAECVGNAMNRAMGAYLTNLPDGILYWHIAKDVVEPMLKDEFELVALASAMTQDSINAKAGMGLRAVSAKYNKSTVENILGMASNAEQFEDIAVEFGETLVTYAKDVVDQTMKANAEFQGQSGRPPMIIRRAGANCCPWCADLEGTYEYPNVPDDVYKHHDYCKCDIEYVAGDRKSYEKIWTRENYSGEEAREHLKTLNL